MKGAISVAFVNVIVPDSISYRMSENTTRPPSSRRT
jgi:hypothetical protein